MQFRLARFLSLSLALAVVIGCDSSPGENDKPAEVKTPEAAKTQDFLTKDYGSMMKKAKGKTAPPVSKTAAPAPEPDK